MIGYLEAAVGCGLIFGPLVGSLLFAIGGYSFTFYFFGSLFFVFAIFILRIFPATIDY
jgi:hypothetical protein